MCYNIEAQLRRQLKYYESLVGEENRKIAAELREELEKYSPTTGKYNYHVVNLSLIHI